MKAQEGPIHEELERLLRLVSLAEDFTLVFLECNVPVVARQTVDDLLEELEARGLHGRKLELGKPIDDLLEVIQGLSPPLQPQETLFVLGLEHSIPSDESYPPTLQKLNLDRELYREISGPLVLVLPEYAITKIALEAPDFWAWRSGVFTLEDVVGFSAAMTPEPTEPPGDSEVPFVIQTGRDEILSESDSYTTAHEKADLAWRHGRWSEGMELANKALRQAQDAGDRLNEARLHHTLGTFVLERGRYDEAESHYRAALEIHEDMRNRRGLAAALHQLGWLAHRRGHLEEAEAKYRQALELAQETQDRAALAATFHQMGLMALERNDFDAADRWCRKALAIDQDLGKPSGMAAAYNLFARIAQRKGDLEKAEVWDRKALKIFKRLGNRLGIALSKSQLGMLEAQKGNPEAAIRLLLQALLTRIQADSAEKDFDRNRLRNLRLALGEDRFLKILDQELTDEDRDTVLGFLDEPTETNSV